MKILAIGSDRSLFNKESKVFSRQRAYATLCESLRIVVFNKQSTKRFEIVHEDTLHVYPTNSVVKILYVLDGVMASLRLGKPDIITVQDPFEAGLVGTLLSMWWRCPLHVQVHTDVFSPHFIRRSYLNLLRRFIAKLVFARAAGIRVVSRRIKRSLTQKGIGVEITVLPIFIDKENFSAIRHVPHARFRTSLVCMGRLESEKQFEEAIRATALLRAKGCDAGLTIVGNGSQRHALEKEAEMAGVANYVEFVGEAPDVRGYLAHASVVLVPSAYEGYGLVIVESLAAHVPVISYDVGVAKEVGAIISPDGMFAETVLQWASHEKKEGILKNYPYVSFDEYRKAWINDIKKICKVEQ